MASKRSWSVYDSECKIIKFILFLEKSFVIILPDIPEHLFNFSKSNQTQQFKNIVQMSETIAKNSNFLKHIYIYILLQVS